MENYKLNRQSGQLLVPYFSLTQISIAIEKMVYFKLREAKYSSSIVLASNGPFLTKSYNSTNNSAKHIEASVAV